MRIRKEIKLFDRTAFKTIKSQIVNGQSSQVEQNNCFN